MHQIELYGSTVRMLFHSKQCLQERDTSWGLRQTSSLEEYLERTDPHQSEMLHLVSHQKNVFNSRSSTEERKETGPQMFHMQFDRGNKQAPFPTLQF